MTEFEIEYHVARIVAGGCSFRRGWNRYRVEPPDRFARLEAAAVQVEAAAEAADAGLLGPEQIEHALAERGLWGREEQGRLGEVLASLDDLRAVLYEERDDESRLALNRANLRDAKAEAARLEAARSRLDHMSAEAHARSARARYLTGASLLLPDGSPYWRDRDEGWRRPDDVVEAAMAELANDRLPMAALRELARSPRWQALWSAREACGGLFGAPAADLTDEQNVLASWSQLYENAASRPDPPSRAVVEDDDMFDGWMVVRRRERDKQDLASQFDKEVPEKIRDKQEVFMMMNPDGRKGTLRGDPTALNKLNDAHALEQKQIRMAYVKRNGVVAEADMPDTKRANQMAMNRIQVQR